MLEGQKILSFTRLRSEGMKVSAATSAMAIPIARIIPMVRTMAKSQRASAANPMMTDMPEVKTASPPHMMAVLRASSCESPFLRSSLYLVMMNIA